MSYHLATASTNLRAVAAQVLDTFNPLDPVWQQATQDLASGYVALAQHVDGIAPPAGVCPCGEPMELFTESADIEKWSAWEVKDGQVIADSSGDQRRSVSCETTDEYLQCPACGHTDRKTPITTI